MPVRLVPRRFLCLLQSMLDVSVFPVPVSSPFFFPFAERAFEVRNETCVRWLQRCCEFRLGVNMM